MTSNLMQDRVQILNPKTRRWIKIDVKKGLIMGVKKSVGPYGRIKIVDKPKPLPDVGGGNTGAGP